MFNKRIRKQMKKTAITCAMATALTVTSVCTDGFGAAVHEMAKVEAETVTEEEGVVHYPDGTAIHYTKKDGFWISDGGILLRYTGEASDVNIPEGVVEIGDQAFSMNYTNTTMRTVFIPDSVKKIGKKAFEDCEKLYNVTGGKGVEIIEENAFMNCNYLRSIQFSDKLEKIGDNAFWGCGDLVSVELPESLKEIGNSAFSWCTGLLDVSFPDDFWKVEVGSNVFHDTNWLTLQERENGFTICVNGVLLKTISKYDPNAVEVTIQSNVKRIIRDTFSGYNKKIIIPSTVLYIDENAFEESVWEECSKSEFEIVGEPNSEAEKFAKKVGIPFSIYVAPTATPTQVPTATPTQVPTATPTQVPTATPTQKPTATPTQVPTATPTQKPTATPTQKPTATPTQKPTATPTQKPTATPTQKPTVTPTQVPTATPTQKPTATSTQVPIVTPTIMPSVNPTTTTGSSPNPVATPSVTPTIPVYITPSTSPIAASETPIPTGSAIVTSTPVATGSAIPSSNPVPTQQVIPTPIVPNDEPNAKQEENITVTSTIKLAKSKYTIGVKEKVTIKLSKGKAAAFSSQNTKIATVNQNGVVTAKKTGTVKITVFSDNGEQTTCTIVVKKAPKYVKTSFAKKTVKCGKKVTIKVSFGTGAYSNKVTFTSSNKKVATVNAKGQITAKKKGKATITVKTYNGKKKKVVITVK